MIGKAIAAWLGEKVDRRDGKGGALGAVVGIAAWTVAKRVVPAALVIGGVAYGVHRLTRRSAPAG